MNQATLEQWAKENPFHARDAFSGIVTYAADDLKFLVAEEWLNQYERLKEAAKIDCRTQGAIYKTPKFFISLVKLSHPLIAKFGTQFEALPCLVLEAGFHRLPLVFFFGAGLTEVTIAFEAREKTIIDQGRAYWHKPKPEEMEYAA